MKQPVDPSKMEEFRSMSREFGKLGGRPRTRPHTEIGKCDCADCRKPKKLNEPPSGGKK